MLVLTRKSHEAVAVGSRDSAEPLLVVTVLEVKGHTVRLGFEADAGVAVHRWEVWERLHNGRTGGAPQPAG